MSIAAQILRKIGRLGGVARTKTLAANSHARAVLTQLVASGELIRIRPGCYAIPDAPTELKIACLSGGKLTCVSAVHFAGLRTLSTPNQVHVSRDRNIGKFYLPPDLRPKLLVHREPSTWSDVTSHVQIVARTRFPVAAAYQSEIFAPWPAIFARLAVCQPLRSAVVALDSGLHAGVIDKPDVLALLDPVQHRQAIDAVSLACASSQSVLESLARLELMQAGFSVEPQVWIQGVGYVDLLVEERVVPELDGFTYHSDREQFRKDRFRDRELTKLGYIVLRFAYSEVMGHDELITSEVRAVLAGRSELRIGA